MCVGRLLGAAGWDLAVILCRMEFSYLVKEGTAENVQAGFEVRALGRPRAGRKPLPPTGTGGGPCRTHHPLSLPPGGA